MTGQSRSLSDEPASSRDSVSVIIPAYDVAPYIAEALASVFAQRRAPLEVVLVNDGSSDSEALELAIAPFRDRLVYIQQTNKGAAAARNAALRVARGDLVAFLDGDDVWMSDLLESQVAFLQKTGCDMVYADALIFGRGVHPQRTYMAICPSRGKVTPQSLIEGKCNVLTSSTVVRRDSVVAAGFFDESPQWRRGQDFEMWFRLAKLGAQIGYQERVLAKYRERRGSLSGSAVDQSMRDLWSLMGIKAKFQFTPSEQEALTERIAETTATCQVELGKMQLLQGQFDEARTNFAAANRYRRGLRLLLVGCALAVAPGALQRVMRRRSAPPDEEDPSRGSGPDLSPGANP
jgi:glycosyltransferase involved in cell wall biosynthesis